MPTLEPDPPTRGRPALRVRPAEARARLLSARLMGIYTPDLLPPGEALERLLAAAPHLDLVQVRVKPPGRRDGPSPAAALLAAATAALDALAALAQAPLLVVNDRPDVALALAPRGCAGVHVGDRDAPPRVVRTFLGDGALIGLSTHDAAQVVAAQDEPVDYLGFGPVFPTATKGYGAGRGPERAWSAQAASALPVFPIGGIDTANALELDRVGRAAVGAAVFAADDPGAAARELRELLSP